MDALVKGSKAVEKWWKQVKRDAEATEKVPLLIFTRNQQPDYIMVVWEKMFGIKQLAFDIPDEFDFVLKTFYDGDHVSVYSLDEFMERIIINV